MIREEGRSKGAAPQGSVDVEGGGEGGLGDDNIMLGFQNLSISCVDPPKHIVANVSGFVVKGRGYDRESRIGKNIKKKS